MTEPKRKINSKTVLKIIILAGVICTGCSVMIMSFADEDSCTGEFLRANKVYMPDNNIKLVIYFNETDTIKFFIFDEWDARHSIQLSNMVEGNRIKIYYKEYVFRDCKEIVRIEVL